MRYMHYLTGALTNSSVGIALKEKATETTRYNSVHMQRYPAVHAIFICVQLESAALKEKFVLAMYTFQKRFVGQLSFNLECTWERIKPDEIWCIQHPF